MANQNQHQNQGQHQNKSRHQAAGTNSKTTPMIVERVNKIPMINFALSVGFSQYDKLKSSNVTVGDVVNKVEGWAFAVWDRVRPFVEKFQEPIHKADRIACSTFDYVEKVVSSRQTQHQH